jgi:hypothetical protein
VLGQREGRHEDDVRSARRRARRRRGQWLLTQFDINLRGHKAFKHLQPQVYAPGIVPISDIQLLEGMADFALKFGKNPDMMD